MRRTMLRKGNSGWVYEYYRPSFREWIKLILGWPIFFSETDRMTGVIVGVAKHRDADKLT